ncbi:hypothetical protein [Parascardovia denticolens]
MIRRIDDADLSILLKDKSKYIGTHKIWDCILNLASVVIAALGIWGFPFCRWLRIVLHNLGYTDSGMPTRPCNNRGQAI